LARPTGVHQGTKGPGYRGLIERAEAKAKVAKEQDAAIAGASQKDEAHRQADLKEVAEKEAEAVPDWPPES
jgi:hypothetical protein